MPQYRVFGRTAYPEPLEFQGTLTAPGDDAARGGALERFGRDWVELALLPETAIHWILQPQAPAPGGGGDAPSQARVAQKDATDA